MNTSRRPQLRALLAFACLILGTLLVSAFEQPEVRVAPTDSLGPRTLEKQTETAVVRDYLAAWQSLSRALQENNVALLDVDFTGIAKEKLVSTIQDQQKLGLRTHYQDRQHDIRLLFYSPEGLSIQLLDTVDYDVQVEDGGHVRATQRVHTRYVAVLTPTEVRWKVRIFQTAPD